MACRIFLIGLFSIVALSLGTAWAAPQMNPGLWEITTQTEMPGMPSQSMTHTQCITQNDLVPVSQDANQQCQVKDMEIYGNTAKWKISCGGMSGTGSVTYNGDSMSGVMEMEIPGSNMRMKNNLSGKRIGDCSGN